MNDPPLDGNENVLDIFILIGTDETTALLLKENLEQRDYRVTVFTDGADNERNTSRRKTKPPYL